MRALCRELQVPLLVLDSAALAPYVQLELSIVCFLLRDMIEISSENIYAGFWARMQFRR